MAQNDARIKQRHTCGCRECGAPVGYWRTLCSDCRSERRRRARAEKLGVHVQPRSQLRIVNRHSPQLELGELPTDSERRPRRTP